ncbi:hypothetical protein IKQ26_03980 [bacterium]|nr:hypothetical protein [bacterium]
MNITPFTPQINKTVINPSKQQSFKGLGANAYNKLTDVLAGGISKVVDTNGFAKLTKGLAKSQKYLPHLIAAESLWLSTFYVVGAMRNDKISKEQKKTEVYYQALVTAFSAIGAYTLDNVVNKGIDNFSKTFKAANPSMDPTVLKNSLNGLKNLKTLVVFATIYRFIGPILLNPIANRITGRKKGEQKPQANNVSNLTPASPKLENVKA